MEAAGAWSMSRRGRKRRPAAGRCLDPPSAHAVTVAPAAQRGLLPGDPDAPSDLLEEQRPVPVRVIDGQRLDTALVLQFDPRVDVHLAYDVEDALPPARGVRVHAPRDPEIDDVRLLSRPDQDVVLALQVAVGDAGSVHRLERPEQTPEKGLPI